jgi:cytochrome c oxidase subunit 2
MPVSNDMAYLFLLSKQPHAENMNEYYLVWIFAVVILILLAGIIVIKGYINAKKQKPESKIERWFNEHQAYALPVFVTLFLLCVCFSTFHYAKKYLPYPAASPTTDTVSLFQTTAVITCLAFVITQVLLFFFAFKFRTTPRQQATCIIGKNKLELVWTIIPLGTFIFLFLWGQILWSKIIRKPGDDALTIEVLAGQFNWRVRYAGADQKLGRADFRLINARNEMGIDVSDPRSKDDVLPLQMHLPKNREVRIVLRSKDVIHSFFIPHFRMKMDAVPGMTTEMHFTPTTTTTEMRAKLNNPNFDYEAACAELCGRMHFGMKMILIVEEPAAFEKWYHAQQTWMYELAAAKAK